MLPLIKLCLLAVMAQELMRRTAAQSTADGAIIRNTQRRVKAFFQSGGTESCSLAVPVNYEFDHSKETKREKPLTHSLTQNSTSAVSNSSLKIAPRTRAALFVEASDGWTALWGLKHLLTRSVTASCARKQRVLSSLKGFL